MPSTRDSFFQKCLLLIVVFLTGAAVLVIEVAATRILSVYFGNTIFTVSSVISVILLALSMGYFIGGRLADKRPSELLFFQLIALSGLSVFLLQLLNITILPTLSTRLDIQYGPIIASLLLFLLPGFLLGMLSPLVTKLQTVRLGSQQIGKITGDVFFWSTLGSIIGSLATGFFLIPQFGITEIILGTGIMLLAIGCFGIMTLQATRGSKIKFLIVLITVPLIQIGLVLLHDKAFRSALVFADDGVYDSIVIYDGKIDNHGVRFLRQGTDSSSAMYLDSPELVYDYTKYYEVYKLTKPDITRALVIGGGAYSVPKALLQADSDVVVDVAEIEPEMFAVAKKYFNVPNNERLRNHNEDGRRLLQESEVPYDVIFGDAFHTSIPAHLTTQEFLTLVKSKLTPNGVFVMNTIGNLTETKPSYVLSQIKTFTAVFPQSHVFGVYSATASYPQNVMLVGYNTEKSVELSSVGENPVLSILPQKVVDLKRFDFKSHAVFTDNYAPVEYYTAVNNPQ